MAAAAGRDIRRWPSSAFSSLDDAGYGRHLRFFFCGSWGAVNRDAHARAAGHDGGMFKRSRLTAGRTADLVGAAADRAVVSDRGIDIAALINGARAGSAEDVELLGAVLVERALTDAAGAHVLLGAVAREPKVLVRLDGIARRLEYYAGSPPRPQSWLDQACARFGTAQGRLDPVVIAVASMAADGRVRERAVVAMGVRAVPELVPFLVLRTVDWAVPVRERACAALALALHQRPVDAAVAGPIAARLAGRLRADFALAQVSAALPRLPDEEFARLLATPQPGLRRLAAAHARRIRLPLLTDLAMAESDPRTRDLLAEAAAREALWTGWHEFLHRLAAARSADVRAIALMGLLRAGLADQAAVHMTDPSPMVRATARIAARKAGIDALERYRALVRRERVEPAAVLGLAESTLNATGAAVEAACELIEPFLADEAPHVRAAAVTALRLLDRGSRDMLVSLLADPAPVVVRTAVVSLTAAGMLVEPTRLLALLADPARAAGARRALYRLCRRQHAAVKLAAALIGVAVDDPKLSVWAVHDLRGMTIPTGWPRRPTTLRLDLAGQNLVPDLPVRVQTARSLLPPEVYDSLVASM